MYQSPGALDYTAAYHRDEALRHAEERRRAHEVADNHTPTEHQLIAIAIAVLLVLAVLVIL